MFIFSMSVLKRTTRIGPEVGYIGPMKNKKTALTQSGFLCNKGILFFSGFFFFLTEFIPEVVRQRSGNEQRRISTDNDTNQ